MTIFEKFLIAFKLFFSVNSSRLNDHHQAQGGGKKVFTVNMKTHVRSQSESFTVRTFNVTELSQEQNVCEEIRDPVKSLNVIVGVLELANGYNFSSKDTRRISQAIKTMYIGDLELSQCILKFNQTTC